MAGWSEGERKGCLHWDEIEIRHGLVYLVSTGRLIGTLEEILEKDITNSKFNRKYFEKNQAKQILQIFFTSDNSTISVPLGFIPTQVRKQSLLSFYETLFSIRV